MNRRISSVIALVLGLGEPNSENRMLYWEHAEREGKAYECINAALLVATLVLGFSDTVLLDTNVFSTILQIQRSAILFLCHISFDIRGSLHVLFIDTLLI